MVAYFTQTALFEKINCLGRNVSIEEKAPSTPALNLVYLMFRGMGDPEGTPMSAQSTQLDHKKVKNSKTLAV